MSSEEQTSSRPSISTVDARVGRLEDAHQALTAKQAELDTMIRLIQAEQTHLREIMTARFTGIEGQLVAQATKLDGFMGRVEALIQRGVEQSTELEASPLGRQVEARLKRAEEWVETAKESEAENRGRRRLVQAMVGSNVLSAGLALVALGKALGLL